MSPFLTDSVNNFIRNFHKEYFQWADVFLLVTACIFVGTTFFNYVIEVEPREWTKTESQSAKSSLSTTTVHGTTICAEEGKKLGLDVLQIR